MKLKEKLKNCSGGKEWEICLLFVSGFQKFLVDKKSIITFKYLSTSFILLAKCHSVSNGRLL